MDTNAIDIKVNNILEILKYQNKFDQVKKF